jgi:hypothetical protein
VPQDRVPIRNTVLGLAGDSATVLRQLADLAEQFSQTNVSAVAITRPAPTTARPEVEPEGLWSL